MAITMEKENSKKKILPIILISVILLAVAAWCIYCSTQSKGIAGIFKFSVTDFSKKGTNTTTPTYSVIALLFGIFLVATLGYLVGSIEIKGVSLGTAGVFLVAILFGYICTLIPENMPVVGAFSIKNSSYLMYNFYGSIIQNVGLVLFVGAVGCIAGPKFFKNLKANAKSYVLLGVIIILIGGVCAVLFALIPGIGTGFSVGVLSGALTTTPGFSAAQEAMKSIGQSAEIVTLGHAIAYPFGVIGVVLFVQLMPKILKADMEKERELLIGKADDDGNDLKKKFYEVDPFGLMPFGLAVVFGLILGSINIPLSGKGYDGTCFSLGTTGGVLIMCLIFGHFGHIGRVSLAIPYETAKIFRELGLMLFLIGAGVSGGVSLVSEISKSSLGAMLVVYGLLGGIVMTLAPMIFGFFFASKVLKLPLLNNLGSITGGMTSTPALGTLVKTAGSDDVASAYAATYPIALVLIVLVSQFIIT